VTYPRNTFLRVGFERRNPEVGQTENKINEMIKLKKKQKKKFWMGVVMTKEKRKKRVGSY